MQHVLEVLLDPILPVATILALGFLMGRSRRVDERDARAINKLAMVVLLPVFLFGLIAEAPIENFSLVAVLWYLASELILFTIGYLLAYKVLRREKGEAVLLAFAGIFANTVLFVLPISLLLYGPEDILSVMTVITLDSTIAFAAAIIALQLIVSGRVTPGKVALNIVRTPLLIAMFAGAVVNFAGLSLSGPAKTFVDFNGAAAGPVALFALGVVLSRTRFRYDPAVLIFAVVKLVLFPALVFAGLVVLIGLDAHSHQFLLASAGPAGAMAFSLALLYGIRTDAIAQVIIYSSALSVLTLALLAP